MIVIFTLLLFLVSGAWIAFFKWTPVTQSRKGISRFNCIAIILALSGIVLVSLYSYFVYRHGTDGSWWPIILVLYSGAWLFCIGLFSTLVRHLVFARRPRGTG